MSSPLFPADILFLQRLLRAEGIYDAALNGHWDAATDAAVTEFESRAIKLRDSTRAFDPRSEKNIMTLALCAQREARLFLGRLRDAGLNAKIISGTRTYAEQDALYQQGRFGNPGKKVTNAQGGESNHNFGIAWDLGLFAADGAYLQDDKSYRQAAKVALSPQLEWGGEWKTFVDNPHYQLKIGFEMAELRKAFEDGTAGPVYA